MASFLKSIVNSAQDVSTHMLFGAEKAVLASHFYDLIDRNMKGDDVKMDAYKGSVLCVVNVASQWGMTDANYSQLVKLHDEYNAQGFEILAFPCNQFAGQEPVSDESSLCFFCRLLRCCW